MSMPAPIPILHYYPDFGAQGGIERHLEQLALELAARGRYAPLIACTANSPFFHRLKAQGLRVAGVHTHPIFQKPNYRPLDVATMAQLAGLIRRERPRLAHVHIGQMENLLFKALGLPVVYAFHGYEKLYSLEQTPPGATRILKGLVRAGFRAMVPRLDAFCVVSRAERDRLAREGYLADPSQAQILPNGVDCGKFQAPDLPQRVAALFQRHAIPTESLCVTFLNRLDANKNPLAFVRLAERLCAALPELPLLFPVAGEGPLATRVVEAISQSPAVARFRLLGYCDDAPALLGGSALVVFTPLMEGFGLGALEAMAAGTPPLSFATGGLPEVIVPPAESPAFSALSSLLVAPHDEDALFHAACRHLTAPIAERQALQTLLRQRAGAFSLAAMVDRVETLYDSIILPRPAMPPERHV